MGFSYERNRPPPRLRLFPWLPAWALGGRGSAASRRTPFLDCPGKPGRASPGGKLEWPQAGRRQGGSGQADRMGRDEVGEPRRVNCRGDARRGGLGWGRRVVGAARGGSGRRLGLERFGCLGFGVWVVMALLSAGAGCRVRAAARARVPRRSSPRRRRARLCSRAAALARPPAPDLAPAHPLARRRFRAGGAVSRPAGLSKAEAYD
jgi:hypothetical protein